MISVKFVESGSRPAEGRIMTETEQPIERRKTVRFRAPACLDCGRRIGPQHYLDAGDVTEAPEGFCPVLFERRRSSQLR